MANNATVGLLRVLLTADTAEFDSAMKRASDSAKSWSKDLGKIGQQATAIGASLTKALTVPIVGLSGAAIKMASDFESSFAGVRKTVDATEPEFAQLAQGLRNMAKEIPTSVNELNRVAEAAGQLGIKKDDILQFTRTMADLGVTTNLTADEAASATAQIQNIFGAAGKDVDRFGATLVALGNAGASTEKDIIAMGLRIAGAGHQVGLTQAQVLAFASALSSVGINAEAGGSAISRVFLKINDAVASGGAKLDEFARIAGMSGAQFKQAFQTDAAGATTAFIEGLARLKGEGENVNATLEGVVGKNIILKDTLLRASGAGELLREQLKLGNTAWTENTALTKEAAERYKTFESQVKLLWGQLRDLGITVGTALLPTFRDLIGILRSVVAQVAVAAQWFSTLPQWVRTTSLAIGGLVAALGPMIFLFGQVALGAQAIVAAFTAQGIGARALAAIFPVVGSTATAAAFGVTALKLALAGLGIGAVVIGIGLLVDKLMEVPGAADQATKALDRFDSRGNKILTLDEAKKAAEAIAPLGIGLNIAADAMGRFSGAAAGARAPVRGLGDDVEDTGRKVKDATKDYREFMNWVGERQMEAAGLAIAAMDAIAASFQRGLSNIVPFKAAVASVTQELRLLDSGLTSTGMIIVRTTEEIAAAARETAEWVRQNGLLAPSIRQVTAASLLAAEETVGVWGRVMAGLPGVIQSAIQGGGSVVSAAGSWIGTTLMQGFVDEFGPAIKAALPFGIGNAVTALLPIIGSLFGPIAKKIGDFFKNIFGGPSKEELAGRGVVAGFEDELSGLLTAQQKLEAGGESWKETVIAIRDAYIAAGRTEEEALRDAERLWASSRDGAEAARLVIEEIRRKMEKLTSDEHVLDLTVRVREDADSELLDRIRRGEFDIRLPRDEEGFQTGTMGRFGKWFNDFGSGFNTMLHGVEAVLRPQDAVPFAQSVLAGAGGGVASNNYFMVAIPTDAVGDPRRMASAVFEQVPSGLEIDRGGMTTAFEQLVRNVIRSYPRG